MSTAARIDELRKKFDENPRRYFAPLANEYRKAGELALAIALCREHLPKQPGHMSGHIVFGQALFEQAMQEMQGAPEGAENAADRLAEARTVFESALALDPENIIALRHLGDIAKTTGDAPAARRWYERVLEADPRYDDIAAQLATLATGLTPPSVPAVPARMPTPAAGAPGVPAFAMPPLPTPDAAMRAVDFDAVNQQIARFQPLDLDAMDAGEPGSEERVAQHHERHEHAPAESSPLEIEPTAVADSDVRDVADAPSTADELPMQSAFDSGDADEPEVARIATVDSMVDDADDDSSDERAAAVDDVDRVDTSEQFDAVDAAVASAWDDQGVDAATQAVEGQDSPGAGDPRDASDASDASDADDFEEGLIAPEWPDTTAFVARLQTPRAGTPVSSAAVSDDRAGPAAPDDARDAFGRELHEMPIHPPADEMPVSLEGDHHVAGGSDLAAPHDAGESTDGIEVEAETREADDGVAEPVDAADAIDRAMESIADEAAAETEPVEAAAWDAPAADEAVAEQQRGWLADHDAGPAASGDDDALEVEEQQGSPVAEIGRPVSAEFEAIADAFVADARDVGEADEVVMAEYEPAPEAAVSFADLHPSADADDASSTDQDDEALDETSQSSDVGASADAAEAPAFVTETMGELLVSQGFIGRAVTVYEELVRRRPYDPVLSSRLEELRARVADAAPSAPAPADATPASGTPAFGTPAFGTPAFGAPAFGTAGMPTPRQTTPLHATPLHATPWGATEAVDSPESGATARALFARIAARRVPRRTPPQAMPSVQASQEAESAETNLSALFGSVPSGAHDDAAARALADAFAPIPTGELSGQGADHDFARAFLSPESAPSAPFASAPPRPSSVSTTTSTPTPRGGAFSFDRFFPDPATPPTPTAPSPSASEDATTQQRDVAPGAPAQGATTGKPPVDDLAEFSAWLKGLGKS